MKLVEESKNAHRLWSVQAGTVTVLFAALELITEFAPHILPLWEDALPDNVFSILTLISGTATIVLRLIKQRGIEDG